jgi:pathogenesis-related protein 1
MHSRTITGFAVAAALVLPGTAAGQTVSLKQPQGAHGHAVLSTTGTPVSRTSKPAVEPASMAGMLAAQNGARQRIGLPPLTWSPELAAKAETAATTEAGGKCTINSADKLARTDGVAVYWSAGLNRLGGAAAVQNILPSFVVSEWSIGRPDYDLARHTCRRSGACDQYAKVVSPTANHVGCAMAVCPSQAQVWICRYDDSPPAKSSSSPKR